MQSVLSSHVERDDDAPLEWVCFALLSAVASPP